MSKATDSKTMDNIAQKCKDLATVPKGNTNELAAHLWGISTSYYKDVRNQSQKGFKWALMTAIVGMVLFFAALGLMMSNHLSFTKLSIVGGVLTQIISGIMFYLYAQTSKQLFAFHVCLERANRFLLTNTICESLTDGKDEMRQELIRIIAKAPVLSRTLVENGEPEKIVNPNKRDSKAVKRTVPEMPVNGGSHQVSAG